MANVDETTGGRGYALPVSGNTLAYDVVRLRLALAAVDSDVVAVVAGLAGKAAMAHEHEIAAVLGLQTALDGKAASDHSHAFSSISGVDLTGAVLGSVLRFNGSAWVPANIAIADIAGLATALDQIDCGEWPD